MGNRKYTQDCVCACVFLVVCHRAELNGFKKLRDTQVAQGRPLPGPAADGLALGARIGPKQGALEGPKRGQKKGAKQGPHGARDSPQ